MNKKPELLAPAGNIEKLKTAFLYGADAVYVGGQVFGLRKYAENFSLNELEIGINLANKKNKKVYIVLNGFAHQSDLYTIKNHLKDLEKIKPHAFIIADLGLIEMAKKHTTIPIHISTQASVTNSAACNFYQKKGAKRIIFAREVSLKSIQKIKKNTSIECEIFVHGAMCASYSGKCVISNYSAGRDSNRGGCVQSCRHHYKLEDKTQINSSSESTIMNAQDLIGVDQLQQIINLGIDSIKIEGRMKSNLYLANVVSNYRYALDHQNHNKEKIKENLTDISNRTFSSEALTGFQNNAGINTTFSGYTKTTTLMGIIKEVSETTAVVEVKNPFKPGDTLSLYQPNEKKINLTIPTIHSLLNEPLPISKPNSLVKIPIPKKTKALSILGKKQ